MAAARNDRKGPIRFASRVSVAGISMRYAFGKATYPPNGTYGPRRQPCYQLVILLRGSLKLTADGASYDFKPGDAILERPGQREVFHFSPNETSVHSWCEVQPGELSPAERRALDAACGVVIRPPSAVHVLIEEGLAVREHEDMGDAMGTLARACLLRFAQHCGSAKFVSGKPPPHPDYVRAREAVAEDYAELRNAADLARRVGVSAAQLRTLFRRGGSESPSRMIWRLKLEHALQLLRSTGFTVAQIAEHCGYANPFHLSRAVKKHTGDSPRGIRLSEWGR